MSRKSSRYPALLILIAATAWACRGEPVPDRAATRDLQLLPVDSAYALGDVPAPTLPARPPVKTKPERPTPPSDAAPQPTPAAETPPPPAEEEKAEAEAATGGEPAPEARPTAPAGTRFDIAVVTSVSSRLSRMGDGVTGRVAGDVVDASGKVLIPAGTLIFGRVSDLREPDSRGSGGRIELTFDQVVINGESHPIDAIVQELPTEVRKAGNSGPSTLARAGQGAVIGGILGGIFGRRKGSIIGAAAGAAGGALSKGGSTLWEIAVAAGNATCVLNGPFTPLASLQAASRS